MHELLSKMYDFYKSDKYDLWTRYKEANMQQHQLLDQLSTYSVEALRQAHTTYSELCQYQLLLNTAKEQVEKLQELFSQAESSLLQNDKLTSFYKESLETLSSDYLDSLSAMLSDVYTSVYQNPRKKVSLIMEDFRGKKVINLKILNNYNGNIFNENLDADGGSATILLGSIIAIYFILTTGMPRIIFFDESLSALDTEVLHRYLDVLKKFSTELGFAFVIIDHSLVRFKDHIDCMYSIKDGTYFKVDPSEYSSYINKSIEG